MRLKINKHFKHLMYLVKSLADLINILCSTLQGYTEKSVLSIFSSEENLAKYSTHSLFNNAEPLQALSSYFNVFALSQSNHPY